VFSIERISNFFFRCTKDHQ